MEAVQSELFQYGMAGIFIVCLIFGVIVLWRSHTEILKTVQSRIDTQVELKNVLSDMATNLELNNRLNKEFHETIFKEFLELTRSSRK